MTVIQGGLRHRLIKDSLFNMLRDSLDTVGWFDTGRSHKPINMIARPVPDDEEIPFNTLALSSGDMEAEDWEIGSMLAEHTWMFYVDFYAENDPLGSHMMGDVRDILAGRFADAGRTRTNFPVYDYRQATPPVEFYCDIDEVFIDRAVDFPRPWQKHWYVCRFMVIDYY
jgi:hypothetical protein